MIPASIPAALNSLVDEASFDAARPVGVDEWETELLQFDLSPQVRMRFDEALDERSSAMPAATGGSASGGDIAAAARDALAQALDGQSLPKTNVHSLPIAGDAGVEAEPSGLGAGAVESGLSATGAHADATASEVIASGSLANVKPASKPDAIQTATEGFGASLRDRDSTTNVQPEPLTRQVSGGAESSRHGEVGSDATSPVREGGKPVDGQLPIQSTESFTMNAKSADSAPPEPSPAGPEATADLEIPHHSSAGTSAELSARSFAPGSVLDGRPPLLEQLQRTLAEHDLKLLREEPQLLEVQLDPPELGRIWIRVERTQNGLAAQLAVQDANVQASLEAQMHDVRQALHESSVAFAGFEFTGQGRRFGPEEQSQPDPLTGAGPDHSVATETDSSDRAHMRSAGTVNLLV